MVPVAPRSPRATPCTAESHFSGLVCSAPGSEREQPQSR
jgi:hypothetical protein